MHVNVRELRFHDAPIALNNRLELEEKSPRGLRCSPTLGVRHRGDAIKDGWHYRFVVRLTRCIPHKCPFTAGQKWGISRGERAGSPRLSGSGVVYSGYSGKANRTCKSATVGSSPRGPLVLGAAQIETFLDDFAVRRKVSANTQDQALNALPFLCKRVLEGLTCRASTACIG